MFRYEYVLIAASVLVLAGGQVLFKLAAGKFSLANSDGIPNVVANNVIPISIVLVALLLYSVSTIGWIIALRTIPLSTAYMFNALAFVLVPTLGIVMFGEHLPRYFFLGAAMILAGILVIMK